jgi:hypothetical protein
VISLSIKIKQDASEFDAQKTTNKEIKQASQFDLDTAPISLIPKFLTLHVFIYKRKPGNHCAMFTRVTCEPNQLCYL